ncbi:di-trans,poly-cis-decaprenylcistransferase [Candidatus Woesearchaeota archaeon]|nr:di-trans,poly-cis-decaprenylcistransferase [Candidatus Woesearchaeota archaeon]MBW2978994.1 di-trans,poly-cis-decaprenylcistransferase [Candidatus Woesearchaeota archaeon]
MVGVKSIIQGVKNKITLSSKKIPKHIAILIDGCQDYSEKNQKELSEVYEKEFSIIKEIIKTSITLDIPILTFHSKDKIDEKETEHLIKFFESLLEWSLIKENQVKISVLGKWYDLPERIVEPIKKIISETKEYDKFFVNFCINYSGKEEIISACKLIAHQVKSGKSDPEAIDKAMIKENLYSSYFLPPQLMIITGHKKTTGGLLLWDSSETIIHFSDVLWPEFSKENFLKAVKYFQN